MANVNKVILIGRLTRDPELRYTQSGTAVCDIGLAVNRRYKAGDEQREETTFVDITFWARAAEIIQQYLGRGDPIYVEGRLKLDQWEDRSTGQSRSKLGVVGETFQFLGSAGGEGPGGERRQESGRAAAPAAAANDDEDLARPF